MNPRVRAFLSTLALLSVLTLTQSCGTNDNKGASAGADAQGQPVGNSGGNGDFYEGKPEPGTYYRLAPKANCVLGILVIGKIEITETTARVTDSNLDNCTTSQRDVAFSDLEQPLYNRSFLGLAEGIYMKQLQPLNLLTMSEAWCRIKTPQFAADVVVQSDLLLLNVRATQTGAVRAANGDITELPSQTFAVTRQLVSQKVQYSAQGFTLSLDFALPLLGSGKRIRQLETTVDGQAVSQDVECRSGGLLDPLLF